MISLRGGNQLDTNIIVIIVLLVIIVVIIIVIAVIAAKPVGTSCTKGNVRGSNYMEGYTTMKPSDQAKLQKKIINEGYQSIATKQIKAEKASKSEIKKDEKYLRMTPKASKLIKKYERN